MSLYVAVPLVAGTLGLCVWLLVKGARPPKDPYDSVALTDERRRLLMAAQARQDERR